MNNFQLEQSANLIQMKKISNKNEEFTLLTMTHDSLREKQLFELIKMVKDVPNLNSVKKSIIKKSLN